MKRIPFIAVAALAVALFSCDKEDVSPVEPQQLEWKLTYAGFQKLENHKTLNDQLIDTLVNIEADVFVLDNPEKVCYFPYLCSASAPNKYEGMTPVQMAGSIIDEFFTGATGLDSLRLHNCIFSYEDSIVCTEMMAGDYIMYVFEVDSKHLPTGRYTTCSFHKEDSGSGHIFTGTLQYMPDWSVSVSDPTFRIEQTPNGIDSIMGVNLQPIAPGAMIPVMLVVNPINFYENLFGCIELTMGEMEEVLQKQFNNGINIDDLISNGTDIPCWFVYDTPEKKRIYIMECDREGKASGRYGVIDVDLPAHP